MWRRGELPNKNLKGDTERPPCIHICFECKRFFGRKESLRSHLNLVHKLSKGAVSDILKNNTYFWFPGHFANYTNKRRNNVRS